MKKFFSLSLFMIFCVGYAQEISFKPEKGDFSVELQFSPFNFTIDSYDDTFLSTPFSIDGLRMRYFLNGRWALRANVTLNYSSSKNEYELKGYYPEFSGQGIGIRKNTQSSFRYQIAPGIEYHFGNPGRLDFYVGGELFLGGIQYRLKSEQELDITLNNNQGTYHESLSFKINGLYYEQSGYEIDIASRSHINLGINALFGADFYIYKGLYLGAELGVGGGHIFSLKAKGEGHHEYIVKNSEGSEIRSESKDYVFVGKTHNSSGNFGFYCNSKFRLGFKF